MSQGIIFQGNFMKLTIDIFNKNARKQDTACLGLVHGDDPERCYGEGGGSGVHVWEHM